MNHPQPSSNEDTLRRCSALLFALRQISRASDIYSRKLSQQTGLTMPQLMLMQAIDFAPQCSAGELSTMIALSQATVTNIVRRLESRALLRRERGHHDKRKVFLRLTESGKAMLDGAPQTLQPSFVEQFDGLAAWEQQLLVSAAQRIAQMMETPDESSAHPRHQTQTM